MGLLVCLIAYALGFAGVLGAVAQVSPDIVDPEGVGSAGLLAIIIAVGTLSALFGARKHQHWLSTSLKRAVICGIAGGVFTGAVLLAFGAATTWGSGPIFAVLLLLAHYTFIVWPALILHAVIAAVRRRGLADGTANAV